MAYIFPGEGSLNYYPCQYGGSKIQCRGPKQATDAAYLAFLGGTETYGRFVQSPFATLLGRGLALPAVNLAAMNAGPDLYLNAPDLLQIAARARLAVVQITGAQNMSNRYYTVHPRRNDRFLSGSALMAALYPDMDFSEYNFIRHLLGALYERSSERFEIIRTELQVAWLARMRTLLDKIGQRAILLWLSDQPLDDKPWTAQPEPFKTEPMLVSRTKVEQLRDKVLDIVVAQTSAEALERGTGGMNFPQGELDIASELPGVGAHEEAALLLAGAIGRFAK